MMNERRETAALPVNKRQSKLPKQFSGLSRYVDRWARPTEAERNQQRITSSMSEIQEFYSAIAPRMDEILEHLQRFAVDDLPDDARSLFHLACAFMEVSPAVERFGQPDVPDSFPADRVQIEENGRFASKA